MDQIERLHGRQPRINVSLAERDAKQFWIEPPSDHRIRLQHRTVVWQEAVYARGQDALHACG